jgi:hypothetical protein
VPAGSCQAIDLNNPPNVLPAAPTGIVWNPSPAFMVPGTKLPALFIFATEDGTLSAPFGITEVDGDLFITYAQQSTLKHDDVAGPGHGFVDVFDTDGHLPRRFASPPVMRAGS